MKNVGIHAAMTLAEIGPATDVVAFFNVVVAKLENGVRGTKYPWLTEVLYRNSLKMEDLQFLKQDLQAVEKNLKNISSNSVDLVFFGVDKNNTKLNITEDNLSLVFSRFFSACNMALQCTELFFNEFNEYIPVRLGITDAPYSFEDADRPADEYNKLGTEDQPFWLR